MVSGKNPTTVIVDEIEAQLRAETQAYLEEAAATDARIAALMEEAATLGTHLMNLGVQTEVGNRKQRRAASARRRGK